MLVHAKLWKCDHCGYTEEVVAHQELVRDFVIVEVSAKSFHICFGECSEKLERQFFAATYDERPKK